MTNSQKENLKDTIRRIKAKGNWTVNIISQQTYNDITNTTSFYIHPAEFVEVAKEVCCN